MNLKQDYIRVFYNIKELSEYDLTESDIGIFLEKNENFVGEQYITQIVRMQNYYNYGRFIQRFYCENKKIFSINSYDISSMCNNFLLRTYNFFGGYNSIGNYLTLIDILEEIFDKITDKDKCIRFYIPDSEKDIGYVINKFFENKNFRDYRIIAVEQRGRIKYPPNLLKILSMGRISLRYLLKFLSRKIDKKSNILILEPASSRIDIFRNAKKQLGKYEVVTYDYKNSFNKINELKELIRNVGKGKFIGRFYSIRHLINVIRNHHNTIKRIDSYKISPIVYKEVDITPVANVFLGILFKFYYPLVIDSLLTVDSLCKKYDKIFFSYNDDPLLEAIIINKNKNCRRYGLQYELIYPGCAYNPLGNTKLMNGYELVWDEYSRNILMDYYNYPRERVKVIGNIRFTKVDREEHESINIILATEGVRQDILHFFLDSIKGLKNNDLRFYIKPHPGENITRIKERIKDYSIGIIEGRIEDALQIADILVTHSSTTTFEAIYNDIPVIIINPYDSYPIGVPFHKYCVYFDDKTKFSEFLRNLNKDAIKEIGIPEELKINEFDKSLFSDLAGIRGK